jgi:DNA-binding winged helix-turn-helix (wHTH) protein
MICRFGDFELDTDARELRLKGSEIPLQPRVFDLLALLYGNRHRVVSKNELMDALWPGVIVGEGSLQRAVSLARSALRRGDLADAIRNYTRQGYRLCVDEDIPAAPNTDIDSLAAARAAHEQSQWDAAIDAYEQADADRALHAVDLEHLADAYQCAGRTAESEAVLERAAAAYSAKGDVRGAGRAALRLAEIAFESARLPVAHGWMTRGRRHLRSCEEGWEHGFEAYVAARIAVATGDPEAAVRNGRRGLEIGERIGSEEIEALARIYLGYGEIALGNVGEGIRLVDEAAATVLSGNVGPRAGGIIYCGLIWLCCNRGDWQRAAQWGESFDRWREREGMTRFTGLCQLHRAEVISISGNATEAEREIRIACDQLAAYSPFAVGDAFRLLGDLHLMRGDLEQADIAYRRAHDLGWDPQPGLAMLQAERGETEAAVRGLLRSLDDHNWALRQRRGLLLALLVVIAARHGDRGRAVAAMAELERHPELWAGEYNNGAVARARAELAVLEGRLDAAIAAMREAVRSWQAARAGLNQAICRLRLAELLGDAGDLAGASLELDAAESSFDAQRAPRRAEACRRFRASMA